MKVAILGAGASGCFAAANMVANQGVEVKIFEKTGKILQKVKVSGGGRCNLTHAFSNMPDFLANYPRGKMLLRRTLHDFSPQHTINWFKQRGVATKIEEDGRVFPESDHSETIIECLSIEMNRGGVTVEFHKVADAISRVGQQLEVHFNDGTLYIADRVLVATGGYPKLEHFGWLAATGHLIVTPVPSLFTFNLPGHPITQLMGVALSGARVKIAGTSLAQVGPVLITHWGLSGPAVLRLSAKAARELNQQEYRFKIVVRWVVTDDSDTRAVFISMRKKYGAHSVYHKNHFGLPRRFWEYILQRCGISDSVNWGDLSSVLQNKLFLSLTADVFEVLGRTTFKEEFVTCGGIALSDVDPKTLESRHLKGLYFAGEVLDVDGETGGYNFQHAWASGWTVARQIIY